MYQITVYKYTNIHDYYEVHASVCDLFSCNFEYLQAYFNRMNDLHNNVNIEFNYSELTENELLEILEVSDLTENEEYRTKLNFCDYICNCSDLQ